MRKTQNLKQDNLRENTVFINVFSLGFDVFDLFRV